MDGRTVKGYQVVYPDALKYKVIKAHHEILDSGQFVLGDWTKKFEGDWAAHIGKTFGVAVSSDSAALEIALKLYGVEGKKVLMPALSFFGCVEAVYRAGGEPVLVDMDLENGVFPKTDRFEERIEHFGAENVGAVLSVYTAGYVSPDSPLLYAYCQERRIPVIEDVAHCHGATLDDDHVGSKWCDTSCWSFFATKVVTTGGEGGLILTDDKRIAEQARIYRNYGRGQTWGTGLAAVRGYNWRMTEFQACIGAHILDHVDELQDIRLEVASEYDRLYFEDAVADFLQPVPLPDKTELGYYRYIVLLPKGVDKLKVKAMLREYGVGTQGDVYECGLHEQKIYPELKVQGPFPNTDDWCERHLCLPIHLAMQDGDARYVMKMLQKVVEDGWPDVIKKIRNP